MTTVYASVPALADGGTGGVGPAVPSRAAPVDPAATAGAAPEAPGGVGEADEVAGRLIVALARLSRRLRHGHSSHLGSGILSALSTIVTCGSVRVGDLATVEGVRAPSMTRIVDVLVAEGAVERFADPADGRACLVRATPAGTDIITGLTIAKSRQLTARVAHLSQAQMAVLRAALPVLDALSADEPPDLAAPGAR